MKTIDMRFLGTTSLLVFGMGALSSQALAAPSIETNFNVTADMVDFPQKNGHAPSTDSLEL